MKFITLTEASKQFGVSRQTLTNWGKKGIIKLHKMGNAGNAYYIEADALSAMVSTMADIDKTRNMLVEEQEAIHKAYKEEHDTMCDLRHELLLLKKCGKGLNAHEFYSSIITLLSATMWNEREETFMRLLLDGDDVEHIGEHYGLTRGRVIEICFRAIRKTRGIKDIVAKLAKYDAMEKELQFLREKVKFDAEFINSLEEQLGVKNKPHDETDVELLMQKLCDYPLSVRTLNCLKSFDINTIGDLLRVRKESLLKIRNFGRKSLYELIDFVESIGKDWDKEAVYQLK